MTMLEFQQYSGFLQPASKMQIEGHPYANGWIVQYDPWFKNFDLGELDQLPSEISECFNKEATEVEDRIVPEHMLRNLTIAYGIMRHGEQTTLTALILIIETLLKTAKDPERASLAKQLAQLKDKLKQIPLAAPIIAKEMQDAFMNMPIRAEKSKYYN